MYTYVSVLYSTLRSVCLREARQTSATQGAGPRPIGCHPPPFQVLSFMLQYKEETKSVFVVSSLCEWMQQPVTKRLAASSEPLIALAPGYHRKHMVEGPSHCPRLCTGEFGSFGDGERKVSPLQLLRRWCLHTASLNTKQRRGKVWRHDKQTAEC